MCVDITELITIFLRGSVRKLSGTEALLMPLIKMMSTLSVSDS